MWKKAEIAVAASAMAGLLQAGVPIADAATRCASLQPRRSEQWHRIAAAIADGHPLSQALDDAWPPAALAALRAGEQAGSLETVLDEIKATIDLDRNVAGAAKALIPPAATLAAAATIFLGLTAFVVPIVASSLNQTAGSNDAGFILSFGIALHGILVSHGLLLGVGLVAAVLGAVMWLRTGSGRDTADRWLFALPVVGRPLKDLQYALWARYVALMLAAGLSLFETLDSAVSVLPPSLADSVREFRRAIVEQNRSMSDVALEVEDWPFFIGNAFVLGHTHGSPERELLKVIPRLQTNALERIAAASATASVLAKVIAGGVVGVTFWAIYSPILNTIQGAM